MAKERISLGSKSMTINKGGLHRSTGTPMGKKIPKAKVAAAAAGKYGPKAKKQATLAKSMAKWGK